MQVFKLFQNKTNFNYTPYDLIRFIFNLINIKKWRRLKFFDL
jgi:hypothetical protein